MLRWRSRPTGARVSPLCVFDAYGTMFDLHAAVRRCRDMIGAKADRLSALWRTKQLEYAWVRSLLGEIDFCAPTEAALDDAASCCGGLAPGLPARLFAVAPGAVTVVSSNRWNVAGAAAVGFSPVWIDRTGQPDEYPDFPPVRVIPALPALVAP